MAVNKRHLTTGDGSPAGVDIPYTAHVDTSGNAVNPGTEDKQDDIIAPLGTTADVPLAGETAESATARTGVSLWKRIVNKLIDIKSLLSKGTGAMAASHSVTIATNDTQFGSVGAAADPDGNIHGQLRAMVEAVDGLESGSGNLDYVVSAAYTATITATSIIPTAFTATLPAGLVRIVLIPRGDMYWKINGAATASTTLIGQESWLSLPVTKTLADTIQVYAAGAGVVCDLLVCTPR